MSTAQVIREPPKPNEVWRHYSYETTGKRYRIDRIVKDADTGLLVVVYSPLYPCKDEGFSRMMHKFMSLVQDADFPEGRWRYTRED